MMRHFFAPLLTVLTILILLAGSAMAKPLAADTPFPNIDLQGELTSDQKTYLGIAGDGPWKLTDLKTKFVLIEIYSMYCPFCQREAPAVNELEKLLSTSPHAAAMKVIGIGAGNSPFEVNVFREKYAVSFPLFQDQNLTIHECVGAPGTPHFFLVDISSKIPTTIYSHTGKMDSPDDFLAKLLAAASLK